MSATSAIKRPSTKGASRSDRKSTRLNSSHTVISYAVFCLKKKSIPVKKWIRSSLFPWALCPVLRAQSDDERRNRVPQLAMHLCLPGGSAVTKMVAQRGVEACGEHQAGDRFGLGGGRHPPELLLGPPVGRDH